MSRWLGSLRTRLLLILVPVVAVATLVSLGVLDRAVERVFRDRMEGQMAALGDALRASLQRQMLGDVGGLLDDTLHDVGETGEFRRILVVDLAGRVAHAHPESERGRVVDRGRDPACRDCHGNGVVRAGTTALVRDPAGAPLFRVVTKVPNRPACQRCHGTAARFNGMVLLERDAGAEAAALATIRWRLAATWGATLVVLGLALVVVTTRWVHRPLRRVTEVAAQVGAGDLTARVGLRGRDEVATFAARFDAMTESLGRSLEELRQKGVEMSILYSIVERVSKSVFLHDLKPIVLDLTADLLSSPHVLVVTREPESDQWEILERPAHAGALERHVVRASDEPSKREPLPRAVLRAWAAGELTTPRIDPPTGLACLPLRYRGRELGLIVAAIPAALSVAPETERLMTALANHCSVAFENARLYALVITDELTQVYSLRHFQLRLEDEVQRYQRYGQVVSLLLLDLDEFKRVNDEHGHPAGDLVLREVGARLRAGLRTVDVPCRYGGEEFVVILPNTDPASAQTVAERLRAMIAERPFELGGGVRVSLTVSIGIARCPKDATNVRDLIGAADAALYRAKHAGRNRVV